jgi:hypothetical protein
MHNPYMFEEVGFNPKPPSAALQWVNKHLLRRNSKAIPALFKNEPRVMQFAGYTDISPELSIDSQGYLDLDASKNQFVPLKVLRDEHSLVSGCPTSFIQVEFPTGGPVGTRVVTSAIVIHPRGARVYYVFVGRDYGDSEGAAVLRETAEMAGTARIVPGTGKR